MRFKQINQFKMLPKVRKNLLRIMSVLFLLVSFKDVLAQGDDPGNPGGDPGLIPVDGGLAFLVAAGLGYGAKKAYDFKRGIQKKNH
jgi:hypothetical protein